MTQSATSHGQKTAGFNLIPFAAMAGGWLAPLLMFWLYAWGPLRPFAYPAGDLMPTLPWSAAILAVCLAAWFIPTGYYRVHAFERSGAIYTAVGTDVFRALVPDGDLARRWRRRKEPDPRVLRNRSQAQSFINTTRLSERGHLVLLVFGAASMVHAWQIGWVGWALYLGIGNVIVNFYPILLQRRTRAKLSSILSRQRA